MIKIFGLVIMTKKEYHTLEIKKTGVLNNFDKFIEETLLYGNCYRFPDPQPVRKPIGAKINKRRDKNV